MEPVYIAVVSISDAMAVKINQKHGVSVNEVREAVILTEMVEAAWVEDERRSRLHVVGTTYSGRLLEVVL